MADSIELEIAPAKNFLATLDVKLNGEYLGCMCPGQKWKIKLSSQEVGITLGQKEVE